MRASAVAFLAFYVYLFGAWITNIIQVVSSDFGHITALLVVRIIGIFVGVIPAITVWF
jgi:hypothetical protein